MKNRAALIAAMIAIIPAAAAIGQQKPEDLPNFKQQPAAQAGPGAAKPANQPGGEWNVPTRPFKKEEPGSPDPINPLVWERLKNPRIPFSDEAVEEAIRKAVRYLLSHQNEDGTWETSATVDPHKIGPTAMVAFALMEKGLTDRDEKIAKALKWLGDPAHSVDWTYSVALNSQVWLRAWRQTRNKDKDAAARYRNLLKGEVDKLLKGVQSNGGYTYFLKGGESQADPDTSNSQYGALGVWAGYRAELDIPRNYWTKVMNYWLFQQTEEGGWGYSKIKFPANSGGVLLPPKAPLPFPSTASMTAAGTATLFVCVDAIMGDRFVRCNAVSDFPPVKKGMDWYGLHFKKVICEEPSEFMLNNIFYTLFSIERIGLAGGYKYFGDIDWYKYGCVRLINEQLDDGSWTGYYGPDINTAYSLLFLIRGQRAVLFNRLQYDGDWNNRPRALANFCRWAEDAYEQEVSWQIVTLKSDVNEWHDAPVLTITGSTTPKFSEEDIVKLRTFVNQGGTLFSMSECSSAGAFGKGMREAYRRMFPKYDLVAAGKDHPLYNCQCKLFGEPPFFVVSNGIRPLAIHTDADLPLSWQTYAISTGRMNFEAASSVAVYATDKRLRNRGSKVWPDEPARQASRSVKAARIRYDGNYDPEPLAFQRFNRLLARQYDLKLEMAESPAGTAVIAAAVAPASGPAGNMPETGISPSELTADIRLAFLTGAGSFVLSDRDKQALKKWVDGGGLLVMDAAGASREFGGSARKLVAELWGDNSLVTLPAASPIYQVNGMPIEKVKYRPATLLRIGAFKMPRLQAVQAGDRVKVIFSEEDITGGLVGYSTLGMDGYESESAFNLMRNIVAYLAPAHPVEDFIRKLENAAPTQKQESSPPQADSRPAIAPASK
ncbi:MAG: DUF4159 domain-containing protein [Planctomycetes bacterium]|nr:DUF4159 domain-containing protein [Planctomycetota bacterium]